MNAGREIRKKVEGNRPTIGKFTRWGHAGAVFELEDGTELRGVSVPFDPEMIPDTWKTLIKAGTEWMVVGEASEAPQDPGDIPSGMVSGG